MTSRRNWVVVAIVTLATACGSSGDPSTTINSDVESDTAESEEESSTSASETSTAEESSTADTSSGQAGAIGSFDEVQPAVVQILAQGSFRDPEVGMVSTAGSGSGFIISPDGLAVTNNHVVTGAATLEVYIGGELDDSYNARVVGVSECNDLALIQIDIDDPLPYLNWAQGDPVVGTEVYAAGFPLGDPEYTLTRGIVAKAEAAGDTPWASIDATIEHDANIQPGNSGGPLVGTDGTVVAVNYAAGSQTNTSQFFAINSELAQDVVAELEDGDFESLGINGNAVLDEEAGIAGVWVAGVAPGSPASAAGLAPGDIVTALNGLQLGTDGTMKDYCDVLRTAGEEATMQVEVLRFDTGEILRGEINGTQPVVPVFSPADEIEEEVSVDGGTGTATAYSGYQTLVDDSGLITIDAPVEWSETDTSPFTAEDGSMYPRIVAAASLEDYLGTYTAPGLSYIVGPAVTDIDAELALFAPAAGECATDGGVTDYSDALFTGRYQVWADCGGVGALWVVLAAVPADGSYTAYIATQLVSDADFEALDMAFATFNVVGG